MKKIVAILWVVFITVAVGYQYYDRNDATQSGAQQVLDLDTGDTITDDNSFDPIDDNFTELYGKWAEHDAISGPIVSDGSGNLSAGTSSVIGALFSGGGTYLKADGTTGDGSSTTVDDTPNDGDTADAISSNWAYDHVAAADPHAGYVLETAINSATKLETVAGLGAFANEILDDADAAAVRTTIGLGTAATRAAEDTLTDGANLPDGSAIIAYGNANWATGTGDLKSDGTVGLSDNWDAGAYEIRAQTFESDVATGTAPLTVASETMVDNLNADLLDGEEATAFQDADAELSALAGLTSAANKLPYFTGSETAGVTDLSAYGITLIDDDDADTARTTLGLVIGTNVLAPDGDGGSLTNLDGENIQDTSIDDDSLDFDDITSTDLTFDADTVPTTAVYSGTTSLEETTAADDSGAYVVGVYDEFTNSDAANVQDVLDDLDAAIAGGATTLKDLVTSAPLSGGENDVLPGADADLTLSIADAAADGSTKGAASFTAADFDATSGNISIDYTNAQKATNAQPGLATAAQIQALEAIDTEAEIEALLELQDLQGAVTDAQVPNDITIDLATTATTANAGDTATAFFPSGTIEHERGGLEANVAGWSGIVGINGGFSVEIDTAAKLETYAGLGAFANEYLDDDTQADVQTTLGLVIGTNVLAPDGDGSGLTSVDADTLDLHDSTYFQAAPSEGAFDDGDKTKLDTIETSADVTDATNVEAAGAVMKEVNETDPSDSTWDGRLDSDAVAGESMTAADYGRPLYCKDTGSGTRWYFYDPDATNTDNVDLQPTALLLTAATKSAGDTISVTSGQGTFAHDGWTDTMLDYDNVGYAVFCTSTGVDITAPSGVGDVVKQIGTVVGYTSRHVFRISFDTGFEKNS
jgi:hypothetical protein